MAETEARLAKTCGPCPHYGKRCSGVPVAEYTQDFWDRAPDGAVRCTAFRGLIEHIQKRLSEIGFVPGQRFDEAV
jgi:hypothetical protein